MLKATDVLHRPAPSFKQFASVENGSGMSTRRRQIVTQPNTLQLEL